MTFARCECSCGCNHTIVPLMDEAPQRVCFYCLHWIPVPGATLHDGKEATIPGVSADPKEDR